MENEIKKLIDKYDVKTTEEPLNYFQWIEVIDDLKSLLKFKQEKCCEKPLGNDIKEVYERFKHLDKVLSDPSLLVKWDKSEDSVDPIYRTCYALWKAVKNECQRNSA
mgnify:CR=1 FL=1